MTPEENELLAFTVFSACAGTCRVVMADLHASLSHSTDLVTNSPDAIHAEWRKHDDMRRDARELTQGLLLALTEAGFSIKPPKAKVVEAALDEIMTIPAHKAYALDFVPRQAT